MSKPTVVLLHGVGLDHTMWEPVAELLAARFTIIAPDLPGHGSRRPVEPGITLDGLVEGIVGEIPPGSHLVGFSLGALVAQHLAVHRPGLVATLTSVSSVCRRTPDERAAVLARLRSAQANFGASAAASIHRWYGGTEVDHDRIRRTEATLLANNVLSFVSCYRVFATADAEIAPELGRITVPTLAMTGANDPGSTPEMSRRLASAIPNCRALVIPGARHMLPVERPETFADCLTNFIGEYAHV
jgi:pimeloyl-ACP methyl ester carboxylesterase